ncbi:hypothetical protein QQP08_017958 [Theobroma cacao]|nr:hypothetical protein QQP08_017958 [Theobroma cacao]
MMRLVLGVLIDMNKATGQWNSHTGLSGIEQLGFE